MTSNPLTDQKTMEDVNESSALIHRGSGEKHVQQAFLSLHGMEAGRHVVGATKYF